MGIAVLPPSLPDDSDAGAWAQWRKGYDEWAATHHSVYDYWAPLVRALGLCPLPIIPGEKVPGEYLGCGKYRRLSDWTTRPPIMSSQPGAGIGVRLGEGLVGIDIDTDDDGLRARLRSTFIAPGQETISRIGGRGELFFLRVHRGRTVESTKHFIGKRAVLEVLAGGRQCVLPPTMHPDGMRYRWGANGLTLFNANIETLPEWPA
jgi:hypothetical protein